MELLVSSSLYCTLNASDFSDFVTSRLTAASSAAIRDIVGGSRKKLNVTFLEKIAD